MTQPGKLDSQVLATNKPQTSLAVAQLLVESQLSFLPESSTGPRDPLHEQGIMGCVLALRAGLGGLHGFGVLRG